jgi:hypothetical protein
MKTRIILANVCRGIARLGSVIIILLGISFLLLVGIQLISGEAGNWGIFVYLFLMVGMLAGLVLAWWKEVIGAAIALVAMVGSFALGGGILPGVGSGQGVALLAGPVNFITRMATTISP